jgi:hypothetical protein
VIIATAGKQHNARQAANQGDAIVNILVLGGYGNFGARICRALAGQRGITLLVGGRSGPRALALAAQLGQARGVAIDAQSRTLAQDLRSLQVDLLIHTAGPFQGQDYAVAHACAAAQVNYMDLADGRRYVCDFAAQLNTAFVAANRFAITGASTVPALSSAVVAALCANWQRIDSIETCIAPAQTAPRGKATLQAVLGYCGQPISVWRAGRWQQHIAWARPRKIAFARMATRLGALCETPDLELFPALYGVRDRVEFLAALEVGFTQRVFAGLAWLRSSGWLPDLRPLASSLNWGAALLDPLGSRLGGMVLRATGFDANGSNVQAAWHIAADHDHGPEIPCMAAVLLAKRWAAGGPLAAGAYPCVGLLQLAEFAPEFAQWGMQTDTQIAHPTALTHGAALGS